MKKRKETIVVNESDVLKKWDLIDKANYSIAILNKNIYDITLVNNGLRDSLSQNSITGNLGDSVKEHLQSLVDLNSSFVDLLAMDKADYVRIIDELNRLLTNPDDENLYGEEILHYKDMYADLARQCYSDADEIDRKRSSGNLSKEESDKLGSSSQLREEGDYYEQLSLKYYHKEVLFDSVVYNTTGLFTRNDELRGVIQKGYDALPKEWRFDNTCVPARIPEVNAGWKNQLDNIKDAYRQQRYKDTLYRKSPSGSMYFINWDEVDKLLQSDPDLVDPYAYAAMVSLLTDVSDDDLGTLMEHACSTDLDGVVSISESFKRSVGYYENYTWGSLSPSEWANNNNIIRATTITNACNYLENIELPVGDCHIKFSSECFAGSGAKEQYTVNIWFDTYPRIQNNRPFTDAELLDDMWHAEKYKVKFSVGCYATGIHFMMGTANTTAAYVNDLGGSWKNFALDQGGHFIIGEVGGKAGGALGVLITAGTIAYDINNQASNRNNADVVLSLQDLDLMFGTTCAGGNLVVRHDYGIGGSNKDVVTVENVHINEAELERRIGIYNNSDNIVKPITLEGVEESFYNALTGESDLSLLNDDKSYTNDDFLLFYRHYRANPSLYDN